MIKPTRTPISHASFGSQLQNPTKDVFQESCDGELISSPVTSIQKQQQEKTTQKAPRGKSTLRTSPQTTNQTEQINADY